MSQIKKHIGKVKSTGRRCAVVFMQLPDNPVKSLIVDVEALNAKYEQILLEVLESSEGQNESDLASIMGRRMVPETGRTILEEFHRLGLMRAESIDNIIMMPRPNTPFELRDILSHLGRLTTDAAKVTPAPVEKHNQIVSNMQAQNEEQRQQMAMNFIAEADMLDAEANKKRELAYQYAPELRPRRVDPIVSVEVAAPSAESNG